MSNITIGRYEHDSITHEYAGWIEPADKSWIIYTGSDGAPKVFYPKRDRDGAVVGDGIHL